MKVAVISACLISALLEALKHVLALGNAAYLGSSGSGQQFQEVVSLVKYIIS